MFANVVLADEINRASPRTQSALLEVMEERQVTVDGRPHRVPRPFLVIATQNPIEMDGTYPLPEAQLDRFLVKSKVGYPDHEAEVRILTGEHSGAGVDDVQRVSTPEEVERLVRAARTVHVAPAVFDYIVRLVSHTRQMPQLRLGASPRGALGLVRTSRAYAALRGRTYVVPGDVQLLAEPVLGHRVLLSPSFEASGGTGGRRGRRGDRLRARAARRRAAMTLRAAGLVLGGAVLVAFGWHEGWPELTALGGAAIALVCLVIVVAGPAPRIEVALDRTAIRVVRGQQASVPVTLHVPRRWRWLRIVEGPPSAPVATSPLERPGARGEITMRLPVDTSTRGDRPTGPYTVVHGDPWSIVRRVASRPEGGMLTVIPRTVAVRRSALPGASGRRLGAREPPSRRRALPRAPRLRPRRRAADGALALVGARGKARREAAGRPRHRTTR